MDGQKRSWCLACVRWRCVVASSDACLVVTERAAAAAKTKILAAAVSVLTSVAAWRPSLVVGSWRCAAWGLGARSRRAVRGGRQFFLQDYILDTFCAPALRFCNALFGGFPLHVELSVVFEPSLASRAWFCGGLTAFFLGRCRFCLRCCFMLRALGTALRVANFLEPAVYLCLRCRDWHDAIFFEGIKFVGGGRKTRSVSCMHTMIPGFHSYGRIAVRATAILGWQRVVNLIWWTRLTLSRLAMW